MHSSVSCRVQVRNRSLRTERKMGLSKLLFSFQSLRRLFPIWAFMGEVELWRGFSLKLIVLSYLYMRLLTGVLTSLWLFNLNIPILFVLLNDILTPEVIYIRQTAKLKNYNYYFSRFQIRNETVWLQQQPTVSNPSWYSGLSQLEWEIGDCFSESYHIKASLFWTVREDPLQFFAVYS